MSIKLTIEDEILLRDIVNGVRRSKEHENRYYNEKEKIICTHCYEVSLFEPPIRKVLAKYYRIDKYKENGEELHHYVCAACSDFYDSDDDLTFDNMWDISIISPDEFD